MMVKVKKDRIVSNQSSSKRNQIVPRNNKRIPLGDKTNKANGYKKGMTTVNLRKGFNANAENMSGAIANKDKHEIEEEMEENRRCSPIKRGIKFIDVGSTATSTPNAKIQENNLQNIPLLPPKPHPYFMDKFFLHDPFCEQLLDTEDEEIISPCRNIKKTRLQQDQKTAAQILVAAENEIFNTAQKRSHVIDDGDEAEEEEEMKKQGHKKPTVGREVADVAEPDKYEPYGDILTNSFHEPGEQHELLRILNTDSVKGTTASIEEFYRTSTASFDEWADKGLKINSAYEMTMKNLIMARLKFSTRVNYMKELVDNYGRSLQQENDMLKEKITKFQDSGQRFVNEADTFI